MFAKEINRMRLTNDVADRLFDNITASNYGTDKTFAATLLVLLHKRLPVGESLNLTLVPLGSYAMTADIITENIRQYDIGHSYIIYPQDRTISTQIFDTVRSSVGEGKQYLDTYALQEDLRVFYIKKAVKLSEPVLKASRQCLRNSLTPLSDYVFPPESQDYLPNPHIQRFRCIGGYASQFTEYMHNRDYVGAIDQAAVSARNLNFHDSTVMETLVNNLSHTAIRCIENADGNLIAPREAIKKLEDAAAECQNQ